MSKRTPTISDELLLAHLGDRSRLSDDLWITAQQLSFLLGRSDAQLKDDRASGTPPPAMWPWGSRGSVRYRLGSVRDFMMGANATEYESIAQMRARKASESLLTLSELAAGASTSGKP